MVVIAVGYKSQYGQIRAKLQESSDNNNETPLQQKLEMIAKLVG